MTMIWLVAQLTAAGRRGTPFHHEPERRRGSTGEIRAGGTTEATLRLLQRHPARFFRHGEIMQETSGSHSAVSWALLYLQAMDLIEAAANDHRNPRYRRYRVTGAGLEREV